MIVLPSCVADVYSRGKAAWRPIECAGLEGHRHGAVIAGQASDHDSVAGRGAILDTVAARNGRWGWSPFLLPPYARV